MKTPLILLHGALGSAAQFESLKRLLEDQYEIHTLDFEGHGKRASQNAFAIDDFVENLLDYIADLGLSKVRVFGYSMGGYVALSAAAKIPEPFAKIITLGTKFEWNPAVAAQEVKQLNPDKITEKVPKFAARLSDLHGEKEWLVMMQKTKELMLDMGNGKRTADAIFASIKTPTIIGWGDQDQMVSRAESEKYADLIGAAFVVLNDVPHPIDLIDKHKLKNYITSHLK